MKNINTKDLIIKIVLIIVIIILLLHNCNLAKKINNKEKVKVPTGNVDIFEIECNKDTCEVEDKTSNELITNENSISANTITSSANKSNNTDSNTNSSKDETEELIVQDSNITWSSTNKLRIFSNPIYDMDSKIAPESSNIYQFVIKNNTKYKVKYNIKFTETNDYGINMKYKLKKGNTYIVGDEDTYVNYDELNLSNISIDSQKSYTYYLEWKWVSSENDNSFSGIDDAYSLSIKIEAGSTNE